MCPWEAEGLKCGGFSLTESWQSFIGWALAIQKEEVFLLSVGLSCHLWEFCLLVSQLYFNGSFSLLIFAVLPIGQDLSLKTSLIKSQIFQFKQIFATHPKSPKSQCQEGPFLGVVSHVRVKVHSLEAYWSHIRVTSRGKRDWRRKWQSTPVFLPGESQGWGSLVGCHLWGHTELDTTEVT